MEVNKEIEEMLNALGDPTPKGATVVDDNDNGDEEEETEEQKKEREEKEAEEAKQKEEEENKKKEEEEAAKAEADRLAEEERLKNETPEQKAEREKKEAEDAAKIEEENKKKEAEALAKIEQEKKDREKAEEDARKAEEEKHKKDEEPVKLDEQDFVGDIDLDDLTRDKTALNKLLNAVYSRGVGDARKLATEKVLMTIPDIVKHNLTLITTLNEAKDNFYKENEDLKPFKAVVAAVFEEVAAKNSGKKIDEIMALTAPAVREKLNLNKAAVAPKKEEKKDNGTPRLHGTKNSNQRGTPREKPNTKGLADEIATMNKALGR